MLWILLVLVLLLIAAEISPDLPPAKVQLVASVQGEWAASWTASLSVHSGWFRASAEFAHGIDGFLTLHLWGREVYRRSIEVQEKVPTSDRLERWFDVEDLKHFFYAQRTHIRLGRIQGHLTYSTPDLSMTGMIAGALYAIAGLTVSLGTFRVDPQWEEKAAADGNLEVTLHLRQWTVARNLIVYVVKNIRLRAPTLAPAKS